jgi:hypothetical protein
LLARGSPQPWPKSGSSEVAVLRQGKHRWLCAIEPWHGNQVVVYAPERRVVDDSLVDGHTLLAADLDGDGDDEIIAGFRGAGKSVYIYSGPGWARQPLDAGGMGAASCAVADLDGDGRPDIACIDSTTLKWYRNMSNSAK